MSMLAIPLSLFFLVSLAACEDHLMTSARTRPDGERPPLTIQDFGPDFAQENTVEIARELILGGSSSEKNHYIYKIQLNNFILKKTLGNSLVKDEDEDAPASHVKMLSRHRRQSGQTITCIRFRAPVYTDAFCEALCVALKYPRRIYSSLLTTCACC